MAISLPDLLVTTAPSQPAVITLPALAADVTVTGFTQPATGSLVLDPGHTFTYTPAAGFSGGDSFTYSLRDAMGSSSEGRVLITVTRPSAARAASDDAVTTGVNTPVLVAVLANDNEPSGGIVALGTPAHGTVSLQADKQLRYTPQAGFVGSDSFTYTVRDGQGDTSSATVNVQVLGPNKAPVARDDTLTTLVDTAATMAVLANDSDPDSDPLALIGLGLPQHGRLKVNPDQTVTYMPNPGYIGADEFTYTAGDGKGGTASGRVAVAVRRSNQPPQARNDTVSTTADTPVTVTVLANDNDPDGDPLLLTALGLPQQGTLAVNLDQTLTYMPRPGFVGPDEFTYTVSDGWGGTATARVGVTVEPAAVPVVYGNGYTFRRRLTVPAALVKGEHAGFPLWLRLTGSWLRPAASGGRLAGGAHLDLRFETDDGTKLAHEIEAHDPAAGSLAAWVRLPLLSEGADTQFFVYYGKAGLAADEASPAAVWADYLAVWHLPALTDRGPAGRHLTQAGTVTADAEGLAGAARLAGAGVLSRADGGTWLGGLGALTVQLRAKSDSIGSERGLVNCGPFGSDAGSGLTLRQAGSGGAFYAKLKTSAGDATLTSKAGAQQTSWQTMALAWAAGNARLDLYLNGAKVEVAQAGEVGTTAGVTTAIADALTLGAGARDTASGGWQGLVDEVRLLARKLPEGWLAAEHANQVAADSFFGLGAEDTADDRTLSPVAVPIRTATLVNSWVDIDVLGSAFTAASLANPATITAVGQPSQGIASVIAGRIRYTPMIGFVGSDSFTYTLGAGAKRSTNRITITVEQLTVGLPVPKNPVPVASASQLTQALSKAQPGDHFLLADGTYGGSFTISRAGSLADPIVIRAVNPLRAKFTGSIKVTGAHVWLWGLALEGATGELAADGARMSRCRQTNTTGIALTVSRGKGVEIDYNEFSGMRDRGISLKANPSSPTALQDTHIHHNYIHDFVGKAGDNVHEGVQLGQTKTHTDVPVKALVEWNLIERVAIDAECISIKSSDNIVQFNTFLNSTELTNRHGERNQIVGNWVESCVGVRLHDRGGRAIGNRLINCSKGLQAMAGNVTPSGWPGSGTHPAAEDWQLIGNNANRTVIGYAFSGHNVSAKNIRIEKHTGPINTDKETGTSESTTASVSVPTARKLSPAEVGPDAAA